MEDNLKKNEMEDDLKKIKKWKTTSKKNGRWPQIKMEDDLKKNKKRKTTPKNNGKQPKGKKKKKKRRPKKTFSQ